MSDSTFSGKPTSTEAVSLDQQIEYAELRGDGRPRINPSDPVTQFEYYAKNVIQELNLPEHNRMMALPKLAELVFWMRATRK